MTPEQDLLQRVRQALGSADVDVDGIVAEAFDQAREEVVAVLRRLIEQDLLRRALTSLGGTAPPVATGGSRVADADGRAAATSADPAGGAAGAAPARDASQARAGPDRTVARDAPPTDAAPGAADPGAADPGESSPPDAPAPGPAREGLATYVFGVAPADASPSLDELAPPPGGGPLRSVRVDGVQALACDVDPASFDVLRDPGPQGLETLAAAAHAHDDTLAAVARETTVLPLPLGTVLPDDRALTGLLASHARRLHAELDRLAGAAEWAVTVHEDAPGEAADDEAARSAASGSDYLRRRREALDARTTRWQRREELARELHARLAACAVEADTVSSRPVEDDDPPLLHGVYLVREEAVAALEATVAHLRGEHPGSVIALTGPWPPYHFSAVDLDASAERGT